MLSPKQKELRAAQAEDMNGEMESIFGQGSGIVPKVGDGIIFKDTPEFNGIVDKISNDQWQNIMIDYGVPGRAHILLPSKLKTLVQMGKCSIIPKKDLK